MLSTHIQKFIIAIGVIVLTSCSDGGNSSNTPSSYSGNTTPAKINQENAKEIGTTAGEAIPVAGSNIDVPSPLGSSNNTLKTKSINNKDNIPNICSSGSVSYSNNQNQFPQSGPYDYAISYNQCKYIGTDITVNGIIRIHYNDTSNLNAGYSLSYTNYSVHSTQNGGYTLNMNVVCNNNDCTYSSDFTDANGETHRITDDSIEGSATDGYSGQATLLHRVYGAVDIEVNDITYGQCGDTPDGGSVSFTSEEGSFGNIVFHSDCTSSGTWTDSNGNSGSF